MKTLALDIGGANLKAAHSNGPIRSRAFALWKAPQDLTEQLQSLAKELPAFDRVALTMTAELCDCFATKRQGVEHILASVSAAFDGKGVGVWSTEGRFLHPEEAQQRHLRVAAANWHALATWQATRYPQGTSLLIDTGSTTTDLALLRDSRPQVAGWTDIQRLASGELVYVGVRRTPLMALGPVLEFNGYSYNIMAEYFATTADVFVVTGDLPEATDATDATDTPDGRPLTREFSAARILRMIGADEEMISPQDAAALANAFAAQAVGRIAQAVTRVVGSEPVDRVIVSGSGAFLASAAARQSLGTIDIHPLATDLGTEGSAAACAVALLHLANA